MVFYENVRVPIYQEHLYTYDHDDINLFVIIAFVKWLILSRDILTEIHNWMLCHIISMEAVQTCSFIVKLIII